MPERFVRLVTMEPGLRVVTKLPLESLWDDDRTGLQLEWVREVGSEDIAAVLREGISPLVIADVGSPLLWITRDRLFDYWKEELRPHLAAPRQVVSLDDFPDGYAYFASEWRDDDRRVIVAAKAH